MEATRVKSEFCNLAEYKFADKKSDKNCSKCQFCKKIGSKYFHNSDTSIFKKVKFPILVEKIGFETYPLYTCKFFKHK